MRSGDLTFATWRKSSRSNGLGAECVEIAVFPGGVAVRDSKLGDDSAALVIGAQSWRLFTASASGRHFT